MGGVDDVQSHTSADGHHDGPPPSHESDSVPPGLNGPNGSVHENDYLVEEGSHDATSSLAPQEPDGPHTAVFVDPVPPSLVPHSPVSDAVVERSLPTLRSALDSNGPDSTQTSSTAMPLQKSDTISSIQTVHADSQGHTNKLHLQPAQPAERTHTNGSFDTPLEPTQLVENENENEPEHAPSPSTSTATLVLSSAPDSVIQSADDVQPPPAVKPAQQGPSVPSANRLSISYAAATRRLVIDANVVEKLKVFRQEARIEVHMNIDKDDSGRFKGIIVCINLF